MQAVVINVFKKINKTNTQLHELQMIANIQKQNN